MKNWKKVAQYLDDREASELLASLHACGARADKVGCGPVSILGFYRFKTVRVAKTDMGKVTGVLDKFQRQVEKKKELLEERKHQCPKCGSRKVSERRLSLIQRLYFFGVKPVYCEECSNKWEV